MRAIVGIKRFDKDFKLLEKRSFPSRSFTFNFIKLLYLYFADVQDAAGQTGVDITNTARAITNQDYTSGAQYQWWKGQGMISAPGGDAGIYCAPASHFSAGVQGYYNLRLLAGNMVGLQVGTGVGAVAPGDYAMGTRVANGGAANQLEYGACELLNIVFADPNGQFTIRRYFTNNSGGGITVQETGLYSPFIRGPFDSDGNNTADLFCICRDLTGAVAVADTEILEMTYTIQITV